MRLWVLGAALGLAGPAAAHPHVFVDVGIEAIFSAEGLVEAVKITWTYDDFYTLMILEDRSLDPDGDGQLTEAETATIQGFDMDWNPGFAGDTYALLGEAALDLGGPADWTAAVKDGFITSTHIRRLAAPVRPGADKPLIIQSFDPEYYVAYTIVQGDLQGDNGQCQAVIHGFDPALADAALTAASQEYAGSTDPNAPFPLIGAAYSDEVRVACSQG